MTYDQLPDHPAPGVLLYCPDCKGEYSATAGDYFMADPSDQIECGACGSGSPLTLVRKWMTLEPIEARE